MNSIAFDSFHESTTQIKVLLKWSIKTFFTLKVIKYGHIKFNKLP